MRLALAIDSAADHGSIALADPNNVIEEVPIHAPQGFSHVLFGEIEALMQRQGVALTDIDIFAAAAGPGSFTGVRVGLAAVKGLAEVLGKRVVAVSNLAAVAAFGTTSRRAVIIDARRGEVFAAVYDNAGNQLVSEAVLPLEKFMASLPEGCEIVEPPRELAGMIARMALKTEGLDPAAIEANYVRRSDAELLWKES